MSWDPRDIIIRPLLTEKTSRMQEEGNYYAFEVARKSTKPEIKRAVEELFKVKVLEVKVVNVKPKRSRGKLFRFSRLPGRTRAWKKAYVKLKPGDRIVIHEGV